MDMKVQGSRSGKALGCDRRAIYSLALVALVLCRIDHRYHHTKAQGSSSGIKRIDHKN